MALRLRKLALRLQTGSLMRSSHPRPLVSLVLCTQSPGEAFKRAFESVLAQTYENLELIVVNNGGDSSEPWLSEVDGRGRILQVRLARTLGRGVARNHGLRLARGEYVGFLDDGGTLDPHHVTTLVEALKTRDLVVAHANSRRRIESSDGDGIGTAKLDDPCPEWSQKLEPDAFLVQNPLPLQAVLLHRSCLEECGDFDESVAVLEDWEFCLRLSRKHVFLHVNETTSTVNLCADGSRGRGTGDFVGAARRILARYAEWSNGRTEILDAQERFLAGLERRDKRQGTAVSIIVAFKKEGPGHVRGFLDSLQRSTSDTTCEVVAVNRGLGSEAARELEATGVRTVHCDGILARALEKGSEAARASRLVFVRPDVLFDASWLGELLAVADMDAGQAPIVGGKTLSASGTVEHIGLEFRRIDGTPRPLFRGVEANATELRLVESVEATASAAVLVPRDVVTTVGFGAIDGWACLADLCLRARPRGTATKVAPRSVAYRVPAKHESAWISAEHDAILSVSALAMHARLHGSDLVRARKELEQGNHTEALRLLDEAAADPGSSKKEVALLRAVEHLEHGNFTEAVEVLESAFSNGPDGYSAGLSLGVAHLALNRPEKAWAVLEPLSRRHPEDDVVVHELYRAGVALGKWRELADALERYIATHPTDYEKRYALTSVSLRAGRNAAARAHYEHLLAAAPTLVGLDLLGRRLARAA